MQQGLVDHILHAKSKNLKYDRADKAAIAEDIKGWTEALMAEPDAVLRQRSIVQLACAAMHALKGDSAPHWEALEWQEQSLLQVALDGEATPCFDYKSCIVLPSITLSA